MGYSWDTDQSSPSPFQNLPDYGPPSRRKRKLLGAAISIGTLMVIGIGIAVLAVTVHAKPLYKDAERWTFNRYESPAHPITSVDCLPHEKGRHGDHDFNCRIFFRHDDPVNRRIHTHYYHHSNGDAYTQWYFPDGLIDWDRGGTSTAPSTDAAAVPDAPAQPAATGTDLSAFATALATLKHSGEARFGLRYILLTNGIGARFDYPTRKNGPSRTVQWNGSALKPTDRVGHADDGTFPLSAVNLAHIRADFASVRKHAGAAVNSFEVNEQGTGPALTFSTANGHTYIATPTGKPKKFN